MMYCKFKSFRASLACFGFVVVDSLFNVSQIVCWNSVFGICFVMHYLVSFLVLYTC